MRLKQSLGSLKKSVWPVARAVNKARKFFFESWSLGIFGAVFNNDGKILLVKSPGGKYSLPGGAVSPREKVGSRDELHQFDLFNPLKREIKEETGLTIESVDLSSQRSYSRPKKILGDTAICVNVLEYKGELADPDECIEVEQLGFYSKEETSDLLRGRMKTAVARAFELSDQ